ncbi:MAG: hypothetical protein PWQ18_292 [Clostridia bacterium]|nr:hypothetical protein [Clostridia bacterium]
MLQHWWQVLAGTCLAILLTVGFSVTRNAALARTWSYSLVRQVLAGQTAWQTRDWLEIESTHFRLRYQPEDAAVAPLVLKTAEKAYAPAGALVQYEPRGQTLIILYPDRASLARQFGWAASESAMGVYWGGVIRILSPYAWINSKDPREVTRVFTATGPVAHEFTHLLVDEKARGNYPRWLTEGIAQYVERQLTGFTLPGAPGASGWYALKDMDYGFDNLDDQTLAYRQSYLLVDYLIGRYGLPNLDRLLDRLGQGVTLDRAFQEVLGTTTAAFAAAFARDVPLNQAGALEPAS